MDPSATKAILRVLGLCVVLLLLVAAATVSVAVMVWHSEAVRKLQGCREQAANETAMLGGRVAELERDRAELRARLEEGARREKLLQRQLGAAKDEGRKLNTTLLSCWEHVVRLARLGGCGESPRWGLSPALCGWAGARPCVWLWLPGPTTAAAPGAPRAAIGPGWASPQRCWGLHPSLQGPCCSRCPLPWRLPAWAGLSLGVLQLPRGLSCAPHPQPPGMAPGTATGCSPEPQAAAEQSASSYS